MSEPEERSYRGIDPRTEEDEKAAEVEAIRSTAEEE
jgi:hypothetical protein